MADLGSLEKRWACVSSSEDFSDLLEETTSTLIAAKRSQGAIFTVLGSGGVTDKFHNSFPFTQMRHPCRALSSASFMH